MPVRRRKRTATSKLSMEAIEIRKIMVLGDIEARLREITELQAEVIERCEALGVGNARSPMSKTTSPHWGEPHPPVEAAFGAPVQPDAPRVTTSPTGCQICGNPHAIFMEVRPGLSQYLCQLHARERNLQKAADAKVAAAGFSVDKTDARPQNIRLPEDNQRAKVLIHPTAVDEMASRQHAQQVQEANNLAGDVLAVADILDEADDETA